MYTGQTTSQNTVLCRSCSCNQATPPSSNRLGLLGQFLSRAEAICGLGSKRSVVGFTFRHSKLDEMIHGVFFLCSTCINRCFLLRTHPSFQHCFSLASFSHSIFPHPPPCHHFRNPNSYKVKSKIPIFRGDGNSFDLFWPVSPFQSQKDAKCPSLKKGAPAETALEWNPTLELSVHSNCIPTKYTTTTTTNNQKIISPSQPPNFTQRNLPFPTAKLPAQCRAPQPRRSQAFGKMPRLCLDLVTSLKVNYCQPNCQPLGINLCFGSDVWTQIIEIYENIELCESFKESPWYFQRFLEQGFWWQGRWFYTCYQRFV